MTTSSLQHHPDLAPVWRGARGRHLQDEELDWYRRHAPSGDDRASAAAEVRQVELVTVRAVMEEMLALYPVGQDPNWSNNRGMGALRIVVANMTHAMLMDDVDWLDTSYLVYLRATRDTLPLPEQRARRAVLFPTQGSQMEAMAGNTRVIHDALTRLSEGLRQRLSLPAWALMEPVLQRGLHTLTTP